MHIGVSLPKLLLQEVVVSHKAPYRDAKDQKGHVTSTNDFHVIARLVAVELREANLQGVCSEASRWDLYSHCAMAVQVILPLLASEATSATVALASS